MLPLELVLKAELVFAIELVYSMDVVLMPELILAPELVDLSWLRLSLSYHDDSTGSMICMRVGEGASLRIRTLTV